MRSQFDRQLAELHGELIQMGALCESAIDLSARALAAGDKKLAEEATACGTEIQRKEREAEGRCMRLLLQQQPVARDLRTVSSALKMVTDMERIGHQSADIAEIVTVAKLSVSDKSLHMDEMSRAVMKMVTESIDAFVRRDTALAEAVIAYDDVVDGLFTQVKETLTRRLREGEKAETALDLLMIAKYYERIGDHAVNIAGWVLYSITGKKEAQP